jgi:uncharacterized damage-inducible protein DinB
VAKTDGWKAIVASSLEWEQAHASLDHALKNLAPDLRAKRAPNFPHSVWELVDHIRRTQHDLLEFCVNPKYEEPKFPDDYWPSPTALPTEREWTDSLAAIHRDAAALAKFTTEGDVDLTAKIPHGTGQTYLRTVLVAVDHTSYHVGQIIAVRRLLGAWPPE